VERIPKKDIDNRVLGRSITTFNWTGGERRKSSNNLVRKVSCSSKKARNVEKKGKFSDKSGNGRTRA